MCNEHGHTHLTIYSVCVEHCHLLSCLISVVTSGFLLCTMLAVQFVMSVATEEGCRMASETFGINYLASDTVQVKYVRQIVLSAISNAFGVHGDHVQDIAI